MVRTRWASARTPVLDRSHSTLPEGLTGWAHLAETCNSDCGSRVIDIAADVAKTTVVNPRTMLQAGPAHDDV